MPEEHKKHTHRRTAAQELEGEGALTLAIEIFNLYGFVVVIRLTFGRYLLRSLVCSLLFLCILLIGRGGKVPAKCKSGMVSTES